MKDYGDDRLCVTLRDAEFPERLGEPDPPSTADVDVWIDQLVRVKSRPFVRHTHEGLIEAPLDGGDDP